MQKVEDFLGVPSYPFKMLYQSGAVLLNGNAASVISRLIKFATGVNSNITAPFVTNTNHPPMKGSTLTLLDEYYAPWNEKLRRLIETNFNKTYFEQNIHYLQWS